MRLKFLKSDIHVYAPWDDRNRANAQLVPNTAGTGGNASGLGGAPANPGPATLAPRRVLGFAFGPKLLADGTVRPPPAPVTATPITTVAASVTSQAPLPDIHTEVPAVKAPVTVETINEAVQKLTPHTDKTTMAKEAMDFVGDQLKLADDRGKKALVVVGERHDWQSSLAIEMPVLKAVHDHHGPDAILMLELQADRLAPLTAMVPKLEGHISNQQGATIDASFKQGSVGVRAGALTVAKAHVAERLDFITTSFDPLKTSSDPAAREAAMVAAIRRQVQSSEGPVVVFTGAAHLAELQDKLQADAHVIPLGSAQAAAESDSKRELALKNHLVTNSAVKALRASDSLEQEAFGYVKFATQLGIGLLTEEGATRLLDQAANAKTASDVRAVIGAQAHAALGLPSHGALGLRSHEAQERVLHTLINVAPSWNPLERAVADGILIRAIAQLPPDRATRVLTGAINRITVAKLQGQDMGDMANALLGSPNRPGTILALPPKLQVAPLEALAKTIPGEHAKVLPGTGQEVKARFAALVNALPSGVGDDLKQLVANM